ncbi:MAG: beta-N-acetylhexosaminidase [Burkholderiaceae bacterium]|nr:beta-N-acetylhexosaminidase [Burkholderiaceae bacterium]
MSRLGPFIIDVEGLELTARDRELLAHPWVGGVIYFARNFESKAQIAALTRAIHAVPRPKGCAPILICVDHEGGRVQRFREGFTEIPAMSTIGALWRDDDPNARLAALARARQLGFVLASELRAVGVDFSFTPVLDLDWGRSEIIGERAFHQDPHVVSELAAALMHGLLLAGMKNCGKHFPGHGWPSADSHLALPMDERPLEEILSQDVLPYARIGSPALTAVMPAHIRYTQVDQAPAGFSEIWLKSILRERLGFDGVIISDDLSMAGAAVYDHVADRACAAFEAGCDATLICNRPDLAEQALDEVPKRMPQFLNDPNRRGLEMLLPWIASPLLRA